MENKANEQNQKIDWQKKGLGWVPDYPDLRDYDLTDEEVKNKLRLKTDEKTDNIEQLLDLIIANLSEESRETDRIDKIKNKILGTVVFTKVKVHKFLRVQVSEKDSKYCFNKINYESLLSKQILELKKCLVILVLNKYLLGVEQSKEDDFINFDIPAKVVEWMKEDRYDKTTQELVKQFQLCSLINDVNGIVRLLETYTNLNEYFSNPKKLLSLKECKIDGFSEQQSTSETRFFPVTSLIPSVAFKNILKIFQLKAAEQISKEIKKIPREDNNHLLDFEQNFLTKIKVPTYFFEKFFKEIPNDIKLEDIKDDKKLKNKVNDLLIEYQKTNHQCVLQDGDILEVLQNSYLFEPIVSAITYSLSPLAQWRNQSFEDLLEMGFDKFEEIYQETSYETKTNLGYSQKELAKEAIIKVVCLLKLEIRSLVEKEKKLNQDKQNAQSTEETKKVNADRKKFISTVLFCFLLKKYLNRFTDCIIDDEKAAIDEEIKPNICDKQEVFEIENLVDDKNEDSTQQKTEKLELFPTLKLYIPLVSNSLIKELKRRNKEANSSEKIFFLLPGVVDLSFWCSPVRDQGSLNSCTAFAAIALLEYFANRNYQHKINPSALFLYKAARKKMNVTGDVGASIRETIKVLALFGVPPEDSWSYDEDKVDEEPPPYCYAYAQNYKTLKYFLLDYAGISKESLLFQIKAVLAAGFPCIFGFTLYASAYEDSNEPGHIPYPDQKNDKVVGGHTAVVVGYDDYKFMLCADRIHYSQGAFLIRNSWGPEWGVKGYGWIPYDYVLAGLTAAWWSLLKSEWFNEDNFGLAGTGGDGPTTQQVGTNQGTTSGTTTRTNPSQS